MLSAIGEILKLIFNSFEKNIHILYFKYEIIKPLTQKSTEKNCCSDTCINQTEWEYA